MLAEIDRLASWLLDEVESVTVIAEDLLIGRRAEASVHQVRVEVKQADAPDTPSERRQLERRLLERIDYWARLCIAEHQIENA
jgi:hypothetical protein